MPTSYNETQTFIYPVSATILSGQTDSDVIENAYEPGSGGGPGKVWGQTIGAVKLPAGFTGTGINILVSETENGTFVPVSDPANGGALLLQGAADQHIPIDPVYTYCAKYVKIRSNAAEGADRDLLVYLRKVH
jgi:hypothetical protein